MTAREIAIVLKDHFGTSDSQPLPTAIIKVLLKQGYSRSVAEDAATQYQSVNDWLLQEAHLPFEIRSAGSVSRLIGRARPFTTDSDQLRIQKQRLNLVNEVENLLPNLDWRDFERLCAKLLLLDGARESFATCNKDDGGIDIYGRVDIRNPGSDEKGIIRGRLLDRDLLFLGQCKRNNITSPIGADDIRAFIGHVERCLLKYGDNEGPPLNSVPETYYKIGETTLKIYFTTSRFTTDAIREAKASDIAIFNGRDIAEFLVFSGTGVESSDSGEESFSKETLIRWLS